MLGLGEQLIILAVSVLILALTGALFGHTLRVRLAPDRAAAAWASLAQRLGNLRVTRAPGDGFQSGPPILEGTLRGVPIACWLHQPGLSRRLDTRLIARCHPGVPQEFALQRQDVWAVVVKALGETGPALGDAASLQRAFERVPSLKVAGGAVVIDVRGAVEDPEALLALLDVASITALALGHGATSLHVAQRPGG